jgi:hypothetical protein
MSHFLANGVKKSPNPVEKAKNEKIRKKPAFFIAFFITNRKKL